MTVRDRNNKFLVLKPRNSWQEQFLFRFISCLKTDEDFKPRVPKVIASSSKLSCLEYIRHIHSRSLNEIKKFYISTGILLAVLDSICFTDGHFENFIACRSRLVPVDLETILTTSSNSNLTPDFLSNTGILGRYQPLGALNNMRKEHLYPVKPFSINDGTNHLQVGYRSIKESELARNLPIPHSDLTHLRVYLPCLKLGYEIGHTAILKNSKELHDLVLQNSDFYVRRILQPTLYYSWLIIASYHPVLSKTGPLDFLKREVNTLSNSVKQKEISSLQTFDIPTFYGSITNSHLYDSFGEIIQKDFFIESAQDCFKRKISRMSHPNFCKHRLKQIERGFLPTIK